MELTLSSDVLYIIESLEKHGHRADVVGGCVRDFLMGKAPFDIDITTSATPEQMKEIFASVRTVETGVKHGTLTVVLGGTPYEVTTYRVDGEYADHRHPEEVIFTETLSEDLARRDFTVNAMCYSPKNGLTDLYGGREDLEKGIIRAVGEAEKRFTEDALRILRGLRFSATLGFEIEEKTAAAMRKCAYLLSFVSAERVLVEWRKLLGGKDAHRVLTEFSEVLSVAIPALKKIPMHALPSMEGLTAEERMLLLFALPPLSHHEPQSGSISCVQSTHITGGEADPYHESQRDSISRTAHPSRPLPPEPLSEREVARESVTEGETAASRFEACALALRSDRASVRRGVQILSHLYDEDTGADESLCLLLHYVGEDGARSILRLRALLSSNEPQSGALSCAHNASAEADSCLLRTARPFHLCRLDDLEALIEKHPCTSLSDLAVDGQAIASLGYKGKAIGEALSRLLFAVMGGRVKNEREALITYLCTEE